MAKQLQFDETARHLLLRGVYVSSQGPTYVLSTAHDPEVVAQVRHAMIESLAAVMKT